MGWPAVSKRVLQYCLERRNLLVTSFEIERELGFTHAQVLNAFNTLINKGIPIERIVRGQSYRLVDNENFVSDNPEVRTINVRGLNTADSILAIATAQNSYANMSYSRAKRNEEEPKPPKTNIPSASIPRVTTSPAVQPFTPSVLFELVTETPKGLLIKDTNENYYFANPL